MMRVDVRHSDDRGKNALAGLVTVIILTKLWLSGDLAGWMQMLFGWFRGDQGLSSATYVVIELLVSAIYGVGAVAILVWSGLTWVVRDVASGISQWRGRDRTETPVIVSDEVFASQSSDPVIDAIETLAGAVKELTERVDAIEKPSKSPARRGNA